MEQTAIDLDDEWAWFVAGRDLADDCFGVVEAHIRESSPRAALRRLKRYRGRLAALEAAVLAERVTADGDSKGAENLLGDGKTSRSEARRKARRAKAVAKNAKLADKMASSEMSEEQVDVIAWAADKSKGAAATDDDLIDKVAGVDPDQGKGIVDQYLADRATAGGAQSAHDRQRALRRASKYSSRKSGCDVISIEGDSVAIKGMWTAIRARADAMYKADGGREVAAGDHLRTNDQRAFDAAHELICGAGDGAAVKTAADPAPPVAIASKRYTPRASRPRVVVCLTIDKLLGRDPGAVAIQCGLGVIPDSVLAEYARDADIFSALFDRNGQQLWMGRLARHATLTQWIALIMRDKGCVQCGADPSQCQAHHRTPWSAPAKGRTDLDELVLLCGPCHRRLHDNNETIFQDAKGHWRTRPATPAETPSRRPSATRNTPRRE